MAFAIILKTEDALASRRDEKINEAVPIDVGKHCAAIIFIRKDQARVARHILKFPIAEIFIERVWSVEPAKKNIRQPVVIEIAHRYTRSVEKNAVGRPLPFLQRIGESDSRFRRRKQRESSLARSRHSQFSPAMALLSVPLQRRGCAGSNRSPQEQQADQGMAELHFAGILRFFSRIPNNHSAKDQERKKSERHYQKRRQPPWHCSPVRRRPDSLMMLYSRMAFKLRERFLQRQLPSKRFGNSDCCRAVE